MRSVKSNASFAMPAMSKAARATTAEAASPRFPSDQQDPAGVAFYAHPAGESRSVSKLAGAEFTVKDRNDTTPKRRKGKPVFAADRETRAQRVARLTGQARMLTDHGNAHMHRPGVSEYVQNVDPCSKRSISFNTYITGYP